MKNLQIVNFVVHVKVVVMVFHSVIVIVPNS